jgi:hypothetical protein
MKNKRTAQKPKSFVTPRSGAEHAIAERSRGAGIHADRRTKRNRTRSDQKRRAIREYV